MTDEDAQTIVALLTNLVDRIEGIEAKQAKAATQSQLGPIVKSAERNEEHWVAIASILQGMKNSLDGIAKEQDALRKQQTVLARKLDAFTPPKGPIEAEQIAARRHGELDDWTKDLSTKLTILQSTLEKIETKRRGLFS